MSQTTEPSMYERPQRPDWPLNALPKHWIEALFSKMSAFYGSKFAAMWSGSKPEEVQKAWAIELAKLTKEQLKAGSDALTAFAKPPTLPEFVVHCRQSRIATVESVSPKLESLPKMSPEKAAENLAKVRAVRLRRPDEASAEWAFRIIMRVNSPSVTSATHEVLRCARDAITSMAGKRVVDECQEPGLRARYAKIRQETIDDYRMRGIRLWNVA